MNIEELEEQLVDLLGDNCQVDVDDDGQIVVYTGLRETEDGELEEFIPDEDMEEDPDIDPDQEALELDEDDE